jgi:hypothetical protein
MEFYVHLWQYLAEFFLECEVFQTKFVQNQSTHFMFSKVFPRKSYR